MPDRQRMAKSSLATVWAMRSLFRALLSASLQLARIQTDSVVEMLRELYPDLRFEIGKFFWMPPWGGRQQEAAAYLCAQEVCVECCHEEEDSTPLI